MTTSRRSKRKQKEKPQASPQTTHAVVDGAGTAATRRGGWVNAAACGLILLFVLRLALTYGVFTNVVDSPWHIAAGLEYWRTGEYAYEPQHPPLGRLAVSALPYWLEDLRLGEFADVWSQDWVEKDLGFYWRTLTLARLGNLVFAVPMLICIFVWSRELFGPAAGLAALAAASLSPNLLAHAGLATLDIGTAATVLIASWLTWRWMCGPTRWNAVWVAIAFATAVTTKFSGLAFLPPIAIGYWFVTRDRRLPEGRQERLKQMLMGAVVASGLIWAVYGFDTGRLPAERSYETSEAQALAETLSATRLPAPRLWQGLVDVVEHNEKGHGAYLLGRKSPKGWWYYFPVAILLKTSPALLMLAVMGLVVVWRGGRSILGGPGFFLWWPIAVVLAIGMAGNLNIGVRHVLPIYPFLAMLAGASLQGFELSAGHARRPLAAAGLALLGLHAVDSALTHPDYLAYFTPPVRGAEHRYLLDSNLDWGQDLQRLADYFEESRLPAMLVTCGGDDHAAKFGIRNSLLPPDHADCCWIAAGANALEGVGRPQLPALEGRAPEARVGKSIFIYKLAPEDIYDLPGASRDGSGQ